MDQLIKILVTRLLDEGMNAEKIPTCIETIWDILALSQIQGHRQLNEQMQLLGWADFEIDEHTFNLAMMVFSNN